MWFFQQTISWYGGVHHSPDEDVIEKGVWEKKGGLELTGGTHMMLGAMGGVVAAAVTDHPGWPSEILILTAVVTSIIPDLDEENSMIHQYTMGHIFSFGDCSASLKASRWCLDSYTSPTLGKSL